MKNVTIGYSGKTKEVKDKKSGEIIDAGGVEFGGEITTDLPENAAEAVESYGEQAVVDAINSSITIDIQRICRTNHPDAQKAVDEFKPGLKRARGSGPSQKQMVDALKSNPELLGKVEAYLKEKAAAEAEAANAG